MKNAIAKIIDGFNLDEIALLPKSDIKIFVKEFLRKRLIEGFMKHEAVIRARAAFTPLFNKGAISTNSIPQWCDQIHKAMIAASSDAKKNAPNNLAIAEERLNHLYNLAIRQGDLKVAKNILVELHKIQGLSSDKFVMNVGIGFQQNNGSAHPAGATGFEEMSTEELKSVVSKTGQKVIEHKPKETVDLMSQLEAVVQNAEDSNKGAVFITNESAEHLIEENNKSNVGS